VEVYAIFGFKRFLSGYLSATGWQSATGSSYGNLLTDKVIYTHSPCGRFHPLRSHGDKL